MEKPNPGTSQFAAGVPQGSVLGSLLNLLLNVPAQNNTILAIFMLMTLPFSRRMKTTT